MTQRRESSSAVLVALIAVVAIGVLFFVAWRFGPGEAQLAGSERRHADRRRRSRNANPARPRRRHDDDGHDDHAATLQRQAGAPARRRLADARGDLGQDHAPLDGQGDRPEAGSAAAAIWAAARCRTRRASRSRAAFRATSCWPSTATPSRSTAPGPVWVVTADTAGHARPVGQARSRSRAVTEQP